MRSVLTLGLLVLAASCGGDSGGTPTTPPAPVAGRVEIATVGSTLTWGTSTQLSANVFDTRGSAMPGAVVAWSSSSTTILTVDASGRVEARGVGDATITARVGNVSGSATFTVEPAIRSLTSDRAESAPLGFVSVALPEGTSASAATVPGTLGGAALVFAAEPGGLLTAVIPDVAPATYAVDVAINPNETGRFTLTVLPPPAAEAPEVVFSRISTSVTAALDGLPETSVSAGAGAVAREALAVFESTLSGLSASDRARVARVIEANPELFSVSASVPTASAASADRVKPSPEEVRRMERRLRTLGASDGLVRACRKLDFTLSQCRPLEAALAAARDATLAQDEATIFEWIKDLIRTHLTSGPGKGQRPVTKYTAFGVRGAPPVTPPRVGASDADLVVVEGVTYLVDLDLRVATLTPEQARSGGFTPVGEVVDTHGQVTSLFDQLLSFIDGLFGFQTSFAELFFPTPVAFPSPPIESLLSAAPRELGVVGTSDSRVSCSSSVEVVDGVERFLVKCGTTALEEVDFTLHVRFTDAWESVEYDIPSRIRPSHRLAAVSGSGQKADAGTALPAPLVVSVTDLDGNPVAGMPVVWSVTGGGSVSGGGVTGADGRASATWTLGQSGEQTVEARATEAWGAAVQGSPARFSAEIAFPTWVGTFAYTSTEVEGNSAARCTWFNQASGDVTLKQTAVDAIQVTVRGTVRWEAGTPSGQATGCGQAGSSSVSYSATVSLEDGKFVAGRGDAWVLRGTVAGDRVTGTVTVDDFEDYGGGVTWRETGTGTFTADRVTGG